MLTCRSWEMPTLVGGQVAYVRVSPRLSSILCELPDWLRELELPSDRLLSFHMLYVS